MAKAKTKTKAKGKTKATKKKAANKVKLTKKKAAAAAKKKATKKKKPAKKLKARSKPNSARKASSKKALAKGRSKAKSPAAKLSRKKTLAQTENLKPGKTKSGKKGGKSGYFGRNDAGKLRFFVEKNAAIAFAKNKPLPKAKGKKKAGKGAKGGLAAYNAKVKETMEKFSLSRKDAQAMLKTQKANSGMLQITHAKPSSKFKKVASKKAPMVKRANIDRKKRGGGIDMKNADMYKKPKVTSVPSVAQLQKMVSKHLG